VASLGLVGAILLLSTGQPRADEPSAAAQSYNDRHRRHELSQPLEYDAIVLPLISSAKVVEPKRVERQRMPLGGQVTSVFPARYLWKAYPWQEQHAEFVSRWKQSQNENDRYELFLWCEQQELFDCSEFLLRRALFDHQARSDSPAYRWYLGKWKEQGSHQRRSPFTFTLPVSGQWKVLPDSDRHHQAKHWSVWAWDMVKPRYDELRYGDDRVENYFSWRQPVYAVGDGVVVAAVDRFADHQTGVKSPVEQGNYLHLDCGGGIYAYYGHLRQNSLRVSVGDRVKQGEEIALVGNSGDSGVPHLHFTLLDGDGFSIRGRYQMEVWTTAGWRAYDGEDLEEGWHFRSRD